MTEARFGMKRNSTNINTESYLDADSGCLKKGVQRRCLDCELDECYEVLKDYKRMRKGELVGHK